MESKAVFTGLRSDAMLRQIESMEKRYTQLNLSMLANERNNKRARAGTFIVGAAAGIITGLIIFK
jgi:hypothetical protein